MAIIKNQHPSSVERASIDEAYVDLTDDVDQMVQGVTENLISLFEHNSFEYALDISPIDPEDVDLVDHRPSLDPLCCASSHALPVDQWALDWIVWLAKVEEHYTKSKELSCDISIASALWLQFGSIWEALFGSDQRMSRLSSRHPLRSEVVKRVNGESIDLKDVNLKGKRLSSRLQCINLSVETLFLYLQIFGCYLAHYWFMIFAMKLQRKQLLPRAVVLLTIRFAYRLYSQGIIFSLDSLLIVVTLAVYR